MISGLSLDDRQGTGIISRSNDLRGIGVDGMISHSNIPIDQRSSSCLEPWWWWWWWWWWWVDDAGQSRATEPNREPWGRGGGRGMEEGMGA